MNTRLTDVQEIDSLPAGLVESGEEAEGDEVEEMIRTTEPSVGPATNPSDDDIVVAATTKRARSTPSGRMGIKGDHPSKKRMLHPTFGRPIWDASGDATPSPENCRTPKDWYGSFNIVKVRQPEQQKDSAGQSSALSRLRALQKKPPGASAEDVLGM